jgi:hypothetical protein
LRLCAFAVKTTIQNSEEPGRATPASHRHAARATRTRLTTRRTSACAPSAPVPCQPYPSTRLPQRTGPRAASRLGTDRKHAPASSPSAPQTCRRMVDSRQCPSHAPIARLPRQSRLDLPLVQLTSLCVTPGRHFSSSLPSDSH